MDIFQIEQIKNSPKVVIHIIDNIEKKIKRSVDKEEENLVISAVKNMPNEYFSTYTLKEILDLIQNIVIDEIDTNHREINDVDIHEVLKHKIDPNRQNEEALKKKEKNKNVVETNVDSIFGYTDIATLVKKVNEPISSINTVYLLLDTRYRVLDNDGTTCFTWDHINQLAVAQGTVNSLGNIRDIISMALMPFNIPNVLSDNHPYDLVTLSIEEFISQSVIAHESRKFHFITCIDKQKSTDKSLLLCVDKYNNGEYKFNKPITSLNKITLKFGSPLEPIIFDKDRLPGSFTYGNPTIINFNEPHNLDSSGLTFDTVYVDTFYTVNPPYDGNVISNINSQSGNLATVLTPTNISIPVDSSSIITALAGSINAPSLLLLGNIITTNNSNIITGVGTTFTTDFIVGDYIQIQNQQESIFQIQSIQSNTQLTLTTNYQTTPGTYTYRRTGVIINGTGTQFTTELHPGDNLVINDGGTNPSFIIKSIQSNVELTLETPYTGLDGVGFIINKNNSILCEWSVFFSSKRIFIPMELRYLSS